MTEYKRGEKGRFTQKGKEDRKVRSLRLTDSTWNNLGKWADEHNVTRADLIEEWVRNNENEQIYREEAIKILEDGLKLKANAGGKIKQKIKQVLSLLKI